MSKPRVIEDQLQGRIEPLLPPWPDKSPDPQPVPDLLCLFVIYTGMGWKTCRRRLRSVRYDVLALVQGRGH